MSKKAFLIITGSFGLVAIGIAALGILLYRAMRPEKVVWDLSHGDTINAVHWPKDLSGPGLCPFRKQHGGAIWDLG